MLRLCRWVSCEIVREQKYVSSFLTLVAYGFPLELWRRLVDVWVCMVVGCLYGMCAVKLKVNSGVWTALALVGTGHRCSCMDQTSTHLSTTT